MRKILLLLLLIVLAIPFPLSFAAGNDTVFLNISGSLADALESVPDGGTIRIDGRYNVPKDFVWEEHGKTVTVTGGVLDFSQLQDTIIGDNVRFENIRLQFADNSNLYANGFDFYTDIDVNVTGQVTIYGGGKLRKVSQTNVTLMGGTFFNIYGGGNTGDVLGDVNLTIGGNVNKDLKISHAHDHQVFGGGNNCTINGDINLTFGGNAKANYIYGGSSGKNNKFGGAVHLTFTGGKAMSIYGGSNESVHKSDVYLSFTGGSVQQIFGGCEKASLAGDILLYINGGKVTRRIYGGCYNNYTLDGWQSTRNYVYGEILLVLGEEVSLELYYGADDAVYAHSRQATIPKTEISYLAFTSKAAQEKHQKNLGAQDWTMKDIMGNTKIADEQFIMSVEVTNKAIVQNRNQGKSGIASVSVSHGIYTGEALKNVVVTVDEDWIGPAPVVEYSNNIRSGFATATITYCDAVLEVTFFIWPPIWMCIVAGAVTLLIAGGITGFIIIRKKKKAAV